MFFLDKPYVSELLEDTLVINQYPVLNNEQITSLDLTKELNLYNENFVIEYIKKNPNKPIYSNSENSINWIFKNLPFTDLPEKINLFKDKVKFRQILSKIYPDYFFKEVNYDELEHIDISSFPLPFIIKPAIGFFSLGVYKVNSKNEWDETVSLIQKDIKNISSLYPPEVLNCSKFIIEDVIDGEEFAIDAYFNETGNPVILDILKHPFVNEKDVSDRVYMTSKKIIEENLDRFNEFLVQIGKLTNLKNFPMHVELRIDKSGKIIPIEVNPLRFAGWCCTDIAFYCYGINIYEYLYEQKTPDWKEILKGKEDKTYYLTIIDVPNNINSKEIAGFDFERFNQNYEKILEFRKFDFKKHNVIGFIVSETRDENEISKILNIDFADYISCLQSFKL